MAAEPRIFSSLHILSGYLPGAVLQVPGGESWLVDLSAAPSDWNIPKKLPGISLGLVIVDGEFGSGAAAKIARMPPALGYETGDIGLIACCEQRFFAVDGDDAEVNAVACARKIVANGGILLYSNCLGDAELLSSAILPASLVVALPWDAGLDIPSQLAYPLKDGSLLSCPADPAYAGSLPEYIRLALQAEKLSALFRKRGDAGWLHDVFPEMGWSWFSSTRSEEQQPEMAARFIAGVAGKEELADTMFPYTPNALINLAKCLENIEFQIVPGDGCFPEYDAAVEAAGQARGLYEIIKHAIRDYDICFREASQHDPLDVKIAKTRRLLSSFGVMEKFEAYSAGVPVRDICA